MSLQKRRKKAKLTQSQLAVLSGIPIRTIRSYEQGSRDVNEASYRTLKALAKVLGCDVSDLMK